MKLVFNILSLLLIAGIAAAVTIHVPGDYPTIQAGINAAVDGDTVMVANGTYTGTGNKNLDFGGKAILVTSENGAESCVIDCQNSGRAFWFHYGETSSSVVSGFTMKNGSNGGIFLYNCSPIIRHCIIKDNNGRGISCSVAAPTITHCVFDDNYGSQGGGIYLSTSNATIRNCTFYGNDANKGGAVYCYNSSPEISSCIISWNTVSG